jgi:GPH family glycoside/pentoside/hexuronide:cation symporter
METFAYTIALLVAVRFCVALYETGSSALAPELAPDYHKRTSLLAWRWFFGVAGSGVMVYVLNNLYLKKDPLNRLAYEQFSTVTAVVIVLAIIGSSLATHRMIPYLTTPAKRPISLLQTLREVLGTLSNPSLVVLMASGFMSGISGGIGASLNTYFYYHLWGLTPLSVTPILIAYVPAAVIGSIFAPFASRVMGKKASMITLFFISLSASVIPLILRLMDVLPGTGAPWVVLILAIDAFVAGALGIMGFIIVNSMIADVVEDAATKTGVRSEGLLLAANGLLPKFTTAFGAFVGTLMIAAVHFPAHAKPGTVPVEIMRHLAMLYLPTYLVLTSLAIGVLALYRIDEKTHRQNLEKLDEVGLGADIARDTSVQTPGGPFPGVNS